jgi:hypothetical protein
MVLVLVPLFMGVGYADGLSLDSDPKQESYINSILEKSNAKQDRKDKVEDIYYTLVDSGISIDDINESGLKKMLS